MNHFTREVEKQAKNQTNKNNPLRPGATQRPFELCEWTTPYLELLPTITRYIIIATTSCVPRGPIYRNQQPFTNENVIFEQKTNIETSNIT